MSFGDIIEMCLRNLFRRRTRTILAIIGVVVGTTAIVTMLSIGFGLTASYEEQLMSFGNLHKIQLYDWNYQDTSERGHDGEISEASLAEIEKIDGVSAVTPVVSAYMYFQVGKYVCSTEINGVKPEVLERFNMSVDEGRLLEKNDKDMALFGSRVLDWFYNPNSKVYDSTHIDPMTAKEIILTANQFIGYKKLPDWARNEERPNYEEYKVRAAGVLSQTGDEDDYCVYMNISRVQEIIRDTQKAEKQRIATNNRRGGTRYQQALVYIEDINKVEDIYNTLVDQKYQVSSPIAWLSEFRKVANMIQMILGGIGGISLFVAALSIANTMIMSIYERTREIGVMKVIGANLRDIRRMFLMEAGMIGFIGGVIGALLSLLLSWLMNNVLYGILSQALSNLGGGSVISVVPLWLVLGAVGFATVIGVAAGYSPAKRAMNLSALESLKNE